MRFENRIIRQLGVLSVPLRFVAESLDRAVNWEATLRTVLITPAVTPLADREV
ncbi:hypothetical protein [Lysinibacillus fusiformis]|uniref:hypothetical protein n=1 Tax=Lysinibacillus fusiformis TaxID=28031 RepID=UPI003CFE4887